MKEITDEQLLEFIEGNPSSDLEQQIKADAALRKRYDELKELTDLMRDASDAEVPEQIKMSLQSAIVKEELKGGKGQWPGMQVAAAIVMVLFGFLLGKFGSGENSSELLALKDEIKTLKEVTLTSTLQRHSASERIFAVSQIEEKNEVNEQLLSTLIVTLNSDESPNVRYAALQALKKFISNEDVRAELVKSLESQSDPLIQISLITLLVEAEEKSAIAPLNDIINDTEITPEVKQQAQVALKVLT